MGKTSTSSGWVHAWMADAFAVVRTWVRSGIEGLLEVELSEDLGSERYQRLEGQRSGYRNGYRKRSLCVPGGTVMLRVPRGLLFGIQGESREWNSRLLPRYQKRLAEVDEAVLSCYLAGTNTRKIKGALAPLLSGAGLSRSTVSRMVCALKEQFQAWRRAPLSGLKCRYLYLDALFLRLRRDGKVVSTPVLVAIAVLSNGQKQLISMEISGSESLQAWKNFLEDLVERGLLAPRLCIIDGSAGLRAALKLTWPQAEVQRCLVHKLRNLLAKAPKHSQAELKADFNRIAHARGEREARLAYKEFIAEWHSRCPSAANSLKEGGEELFTHYRFPATQWRSLRTTNPIERLNEEFRRRVKTQGSLPGEEAALVLLYGLVATGQIKLRKIDGFTELDHHSSVANRAAA